VERTCSLSSLEEEETAIKNLKGRMINVRVCVFLNFKTLRFSTCGRVIIHNDFNGPPYASIGHFQCDPNTLLKLDPIGIEGDYLIECTINKK